MMLTKERERHDKAVERLEVAHAAWNKKGATIRFYK